MLNIKLSADHARYETAVKEMIENELRWNPNFNGESFEIEIGDFTCIDNSNDEVRDSALLRKIFNLIQGV